MLLLLNILLVEEDEVKAARALKESEEQLQFAIEATELGTWDLDLSNNKFKCNSRLKEWFGLEPDEKIDLSIGLASITEYVRGRVSTAIESVIQFSLGGQYDIIYRVGQRAAVQGTGTAINASGGDTLTLTGTGNSLAVSGEVGSSPVVLCTPCRFSRRVFKAV